MRRRAAVLHELGMTLEVFRPMADERSLTGMRTRREGHDETEFPLEKSFTCS